MMKHKNKLLLMAVVFTLFQGCASCLQEPCVPGIKFPEPGSCPLKGHPQGSSGGKCNNFIGNFGCDDPDHTCVSNTCIPCGQPGSVCCEHQGCDGMATCVKPKEDHTFSVCSNECVQVGDSCCTNNQCGSGMVCNANLKQCVPANEPTCGMGPTLFALGVISDNTKCGDVIFIKEASLQAAKQCVQPQVQAAGTHFAPDNTPLQEFTFCNSGSGIDPSATVTVAAFSSTDAATCAHNLCTNCASTAPGPCP
ncbi:hypothetical protein [Corallococcus llansteffanensis]|uniref:Dickkopf N-terminal cysteine-rich domain-containing protein n=1 Tax=Corallococcus llansteffanensis TaxID=2316731 RepID=A0A3A8PJV4_9BACT|nr:hypothetical protein [Corallococcus llansteffanensis]RKH54941.1 hypothetical protein D7V93_24265 [Corallococcus llansteffanensis]